MSGLQGTMGSSAGFKKRNLLRPASGMLNKKQQFLRSVDISQAEPTIATLIRTEVAAIDEEINLLDKDRRLRQGQGGFQKGYVTTLKKWLANNYLPAERQDQDAKILRHMGVESYQTGFRKLWKVACNLDLAISKMSQLQIVHFLLYDDMFNDIGADSPKSTNSLSTITNNGYNACGFGIAQILLDREKDLFAAVKRGSTAKGKEQGRRQDSKSRQQTNQLIAQLRRQNSKLNDLLQKLTNQREKEKQSAKEKAKQQSQKQNKPAFVTQSSGSSKEIIRAFEQKYDQKINQLNEQKARVEQIVLQLRLKVSSLEAELKVYKTPDGKDEVVHKAKAGSYEQALIEEMQKMKKGFEKKIAVLTQQFTIRQRELRRKEAEYKTQHERIKWEKSLLLRKFDLLSK